MKLLMTFLLAMCIMVGCSPLTKRGDVTKTSIDLPDGTTIIFVRIQRIRLFTPSTEEKMTFLKDVNGVVIRTKNLAQNYQPGIATSILDTLIESGVIAATAGVSE